MAAGTYPNTAIPELTNSQIKDIVMNLDIGFNTTIFCALLNIFDMYTGWATSIAAFTTLARKSVSETYSLSNSPPLVLLTEGVLSSLSTVLADATLAWDLILYGAVGLSGVGLTSSAVHTASRVIQAYYDSVGPHTSPQALFLEKAVNWAVLYASLVMATLLWCTILIIYRILRVGGAAGRIHVYQRVIEMLVESALLYSAVTVVLLVFEARNEMATVYIQALVLVMRGIMPTMLVGRVAAGHARPDDSWSDSTPGSSIRFGNHSTSQNDTEMSVGSERDTSSVERPDLEKGLGDITKTRVEGASSIDSTHDYYHVVDIRLWSTNSRSSID
ncbi:hypothetical protein EDD18DRAFT_1423770 [Armillaria luteobubalina]|uniref:Transmembrane protein n=1 Tax=Armillaria luteobubalina TaxID=153913 RepID=A0AA39PPN2_9AGAR|nr:hypothetical protein EDD18DRAFT_1423770 [Armillaria luteobubalina]